MIRATVTVTFEAADEVEAETLVGGWSLHEGSQVSMAMNSVRTGTADGAGHVDLVLPATAVPPPPPMPDAPLDPMLLPEPAPEPLPEPPAP